MIVIATHNGLAFLPNLIRSLAVYGTGGHRVLVVDTGSTDEQFVQYLEILRVDAPIELQFARTPYKGYDSGAYIWAFQNTHEESYLCIQDSLCIKSSGWVAQFEQKWADDVGIVAWQMFGPRYDNADEEAFVQRHMGSLTMSEGGIFGPIFYTKRPIVEEFQRRGFFSAIPTNKNDQMAMERGWSVACNAIKKRCVSVRPYDRGAMRRDELPDMQKLFPRRD